MDTEPGAAEPALTAGFCFFALGVVCGAGGSDLEIPAPLPKPIFSLPAAGDFGFRGGVESAAKRPWASRW